MSLMVSMVNLVDPTTDPTPEKSESISQILASAVFALRREGVPLTIPQVTLTGVKHHPYRRRLCQPQEPNPRAFPRSVEDLHIDPARPDRPLTGLALGGTPTRLHRLHMLATCRVPCPRWLMEIPPMNLPIKAPTHNEVTFNAQENELSLFHAPWNNHPYPETPPPEPFSGAAPVYTRSVYTGATSKIWATRTAKMPFEPSVVLENSRFQSFCSQQKLLA